MENCLRLQAQSPGISKSRSYVNKKTKNEDQAQNKLIYCHKLPILTNQRHRECSGKK